ncbi:MAG: rsmG [Proteobacteria bacterium]|nr:rsmG [Pseudomonadota bacterium]
MIADEADARAFTAGFADKAALERLERLAILLTEENARQNLVAAATLPAIWQRHFADSAQLLAHVPRGSEALPKAETSDPGPWLDLGTGAGFPGLVIAALRPEWDIRLVESRRPLPKLLDLSTRFSTDRTLWLLPKGRSAAQELASLPESVRKLFHVEQSCTDAEAGIVVGRLESGPGGR